jgi:hypothetical protein
MIEATEENYNSGTLKECQKYKFQGTKRDNAKEKP